MKHVTKTVQSVHLLLDYTYYVEVFGTKNNTPYIFLQKSTQCV
jgi:hypothetical protein